MFLADKPIECSKNDILKRTIFSKQLAEAILSYTAIDNFTISLCGKWGSGKTSILNMVEEHIISLSKDIAKEKQPVIIHFNPWNYSDRSQLTVQFFKELQSVLGTESSAASLKKVGTALQNYSSIFEYAEYIPVAGKFFKPLKSLAGNLGKGFTDLSKNKSSLEEQRKNVIDALKSQSQKLIIVIDDIDRLNNEQIRLIFQLVNSLAGFPNMIYLLSFDRGIVVRALSDEQKCNGEEYLEKIVQVPFDVPEIQPSLVQQLFFDKLDKILFDEIPCDDFDSKYWNNVFSYCISPFLKDIRDVNRIINVYHFQYGLMHKETNCIDLLALTTFQVCAPSIYNWIRINKNRLVGSSYGKGTTGVEQKKYNQDLLNELLDIYVSPETMLNALQVLFPSISWKCGGYFNSYDTDDELRRKQRIASADRFLLYFNLSLESIKISKEMIMKSINDFDKDRLTEFFEELSANGSLDSYLQELLAYIPEIPELKLSDFLKVLVWAQTMNANYNNKDILSPIPAYKCERCCWLILKRFDKDLIDKEIKSLIVDSNLDEFSIITQIIVSIEAAYGRIGKDTDYNYRIIDESKLPGLEKCFQEKIELLCSSYNLLDSINFVSIYRLWLYLDKESLQRYICSKMEIASNVPKYLYMIAGHWSGGSDHGWSFSEKSFDDGFPSKSAYSQIIKLKGTKDFSNLRLEHKEITVAFYLWNNKTDNEDFYKVTKTSVDKLIQEWEFEN